jgi:hypothetical protein
MKKKWQLKLLPSLKIRENSLEYLLGLILTVLLLVNLISNFEKNDFSDRDDFRDLISVMRTDCVPGTALLSYVNFEFPVFDYYRFMMYTRRDIWTLRFSKLNANFIKEFFKENNVINHLPAFFDSALAGQHMWYIGTDTYDLDKEFTLYRIESKHPLRFIFADYANLIFPKWQAMTNRALYYALPKGVQGTLDAPSLHVSKENNAEFSRLVLNNLRYVPEAEALMIQEAYIPVNLLVPKVPGKKMSLTLGLGRMADTKAPSTVQRIEILFYLNNTIKSLQTFDLTAPTQKVKLEFDSEELASPFNILSLVPLADSTNGSSRRIALSWLYKIYYIDIRIVD